MEEVKNLDDKMETVDLVGDEALARKKAWKELNNLVEVKNQIRFQQSRNQ